MAQSGSHGHAVYLEFHDTWGKGRVGQLLFIAAGMFAGDIVPFRLMSRTVTAEHPSIQWRQDFNVEKNSVLDAHRRPNGLGFIPQDSTREAYTLAVAQYSYVSGTLDAMSNPAWVLYKEPLVLQVSQLDYQDLHSKERPRRLIDRLDRARSAADWSPLPSRNSRPVFKVSAK